MTASGTSNDAYGSADWVSAAERLGLRLRRQAQLRVRERPSLAIERLGYQVVVVPYLGRGVLGRTERGSSVIEIVPHAFDRKREYTLAHELLELALPRERISGRPRERVCQRGAASFLLPSFAFKRSLFLAAWDLPTLMRWWRWASAEAIGFRIADLYAWASFVVWSDDHVRRSGGGEPTDVERHAYRVAHQSVARIEGDSQVVCAWRLTEPGVRVKVAAVSLATGPRLDAILGRVAC